MIRFLPVLLLCLALPAIADDLGRLFTTPQERSALDNLRLNNKAPALSLDEPEAAEPKKPVVVAPVPLSVQGYVRRNDGKKGTVWVNRQALQEDSANDEVRVGKLKPDSNRVPLKLPGSGKVVSLKAGQVYQPDTNRVSEAGVESNSEGSAEAAKPGPTASESQ